MPRICAICSHPNQMAIDKAILSKLSIAKIALDFDIATHSLHYHKDTHLNPIIDEANQRARDVIIQDVIDCRKEVQYATLDKVKLMQERLLNDIDFASSAQDRLPFIKEFRGFITEEAKLTGAYTQDRPNTDSMEKVLSSFNLWIDLNPHANGIQRAIAIKEFAVLSKVDERELALKVGVQVLGKTR